MKSLYEELIGTYRQVGDYFIPDIELPERNYEIANMAVCAIAISKSIAKTSTQP
jgi:hypothetical protein